jgi:mono/diheme cytochrome c family protein
VLKDIHMRKLALVCVIAGAVFISVIVLPPERIAASGANKSQIERGRYLVEEVAKCPECHTARNERGELQKDEWLRGAPIWIQPVKPIQNWADRAPALAGLPSFTQEQTVRVLEKGTGPNGEELRPPMHIYHMSAVDARAIAAYLKSLPRGASTE